MQIFHRWGYNVCMAARSTLVVGVVLLHSCFLLLYVACELLSRTLELILDPHPCLPMLAFPFERRATVCEVVGPLVCRNVCRGRVFDLLQSR